MTQRHYLQRRHAQTGKNYCDWKHAHAWHVHHLCLQRFTGFPDMAYLIPNTVAFQTDEFVEYGPAGIVDPAVVTHADHVKALTHRGHGLGVGPVDGVILREP